MPGAQLREWTAKRPANRVPTPAAAGAAEASAAATLAESGAPLVRNDTTPGA
jgi:hypothetical protein